MTPEQQRKIDELHAFVIDYQRAGKTRRQFWEEFDALEGDLRELAFSDDADPDLREALCEVLANADDAGYAAAPERDDEIMGG
jgi:hypothetical protein